MGNRIINGDNDGTANNKSGIQRVVPTQVG
jgi:hypothetical protein